MLSNKDVPEALPTNDTDIPKELPDEERGTTQSIYISPVLWTKMHKYSENVSRDISNLVAKFVAEHEGKAETKPVFDYTQKMTDLALARRHEQEAKSQLEKELVRIQPDVSAFYELDLFAVSLVEKKTHEQNNGPTSIRALQELRTKLVQYRMNGREDWNLSQKFLYIRYIDIMILRKKLEHELEEHLTKS
jgi:hypothetical protein